jgi:hypothetical protein
VLASLMAVPLLFAGDLPDPLAIHWGLGGEPDGKLALWGLVTLLGGLFTGIWVVSLTAQRGGTLLSPVVAVLYAVGGLLLAALVTTLVANDGAATWSDAAEVGWRHVLVIFAGGLAAGAAGWLLAGGRRGVSSSDGDIPVASVDLDEDEVAVWMSVGASIWAPALGLAGLAAALVMKGAGGVLLGVVGLLLLAVAAVRVTVGAAGVGIGLGWWGWPRWVVPLESVSRAEVLHVEPLAYGGWGYRILSGRVLTGARAIVVRRGPGIRLVREDRPDLIVTVDDADRGAGLVNELLRRRGLLRTG